jgi:hypothetical protein
MERRPEDYHETLAYANVLILLGVVVAIALIWLWVLPHDRIPALATAAVGG